MSTWEWDGARRNLAHKSDTELTETKRAPFVCEKSRAVLEAFARQFGRPREASLTSQVRRIVLGGSAHGCAKSTTRALSVRGRGKG